MFKSVFHWKVLLNIILAIGVFIGLVWLTFRWLEFHTNHGEEIPVPNVVNHSVQDAIRILDDSGLEYEVDSFKYDPKYKPLQVLKIYPAPGAKVKGGRVIILKVNPKTWAKVSVPDILDRYKGLAFRQLSQVGLKVGDTLYEPNIQRDAVIRMLYNGTALKPGTLLPRFSTIDLVIGSGPKRNIIIPNVVGLTVQEAKKLIQQSLFEVGLIEHEDGGRDESDIVYYQDPEALDVRDQGMQIDIWASKKTPAEMSSKIEQLNSVYRVKIDTTMPSSSTFDVPVYKEQKTVSKNNSEFDELSSGSVAKQEPTVNVDSKLKQDNSSGKSENTSQKKTVTKPDEKTKKKKVVVE